MVALLSDLGLGSSQELGLGCAMLMLVCGCSSAENLVLQQHSHLLVRLQRKGG